MSCSSHFVIETVDSVLKQTYQQPTIRSLFIGFRASYTIESCNVGGQIWIDKFSNCLIRSFDNKMQYLEMIDKLQRNKCFYDTTFGFFNRTIDYIIIPDNEWKTYNRRLLEMFML